MAKVPTDSQWQDLANRINSKNKIITAIDTSNSQSYTINVPCISGSTQGFIHILSVYCFTKNEATSYVCSWTKNGNTTAKNTTGNATTLSLRLNSVNDTNGTANITFTFNDYVWGGVRVLAIC